jgi:hypothetical protein
MVGLSKAQRFELDARFDADATFFAQPGFVATREAWYAAFPRAG